MRPGVILLWLAEGFIVRLVAAAMLLSLAAAGPARAGRETISIAVTEPQPATLTGDLYTPAAGPLTRRRLFHGCGALAERARLGAVAAIRGYAALVVDAFRRGRSCPARPLPPRVRAADVYAAAAAGRWASSMATDRGMGFSRGQPGAHGRRTQPKHRT
jgi:hypothetical protein